MREIRVVVRREREGRVWVIARARGARACAAVDARRPDGEGWSLVTLSIPNDQVGSLVEELRAEMEEADIVLAPQAVLPLGAGGDVAEEVRDVARLSTLELTLSSLQSIGSWRGLLLYSVFSGVIAAYAILLNISFLLIGAMLISPTGAPVMVSAVGAATGDWKLVRRAALRFVVSVVVLVGCAAALGLAYGLNTPTATMQLIASISIWTAPLAVVAGAAGAQSQVMSERTSLVSGSSAGFLVAAALSTSAAVLGLSLTIARWKEAEAMALQLGLQFLGIVLGGWLLLRGMGVGPKEFSVSRGSRRGSFALAGALLLLTLGLGIWQERAPVHLRRADLARQAMDLAGEATRDVAGVELLETAAHFTRAETSYRDDGLLVIVMVERRAGAPPAPALERRVREAVRARLEAGLSEGVVLFIDVTVLPGRDGEVEVGR